MSRSRRSAHARGASLIEVMVSLFLVALFAGALHQFARVILQGVRALELASEAQEAARIGAHLITSDLRCAGYSSTGAFGNGVRVARVDAVEIETDLNGDGDSNDTSEIIGYDFDGVHTLRRTMGTGSPQPLLSDVAPGGVTFAYFDAAGAPIAADADMLAADRRRIRRIDVALAITVASPHPLGSMRASQTVSVALRNH